MKVRQSLIAVAIFGLILLGNAFAKDNQSGKFTLNEPAKIGNTQLQPGDYKAEWSGPADNVQVSILQKGKTVATTQGKIKNLQSPAPYGSVSEHVLPDQSKKVDEIDFGKSKEALVVGGE